MPYSARVMAKRKPKPSEVFQTQATRQPRSFPPGSVLFLLSFAPLIWTIQNQVHGDVLHYAEWGKRLTEHATPYVDFAFQYPPYILAWFYLPALVGSLQAFQVLFGVQLLVLDGAVKAMLLVEGAKWHKGRRFIVPFLVFMGAGLLQHYLYLKRFDLVPAALTFLAVSFATHDAFRSAGVMLAIGAATKLYPMLLVPVILVVAWRRGKADEFVLALLVALVPLALLSIWMPWWNFAALHEARGLQVESLYAAALWLGHYAGGAAVWVPAKASYEVQGGLADTLLPIAKVILVATTLASVALASWRAKDDAARHPGRLARLCLLPLLAFVAFNFVLSPQYLIWLMGLVALATLEAWTWPLIAACVACALTPIIFPSPTYRSGLDLPRTIVLNLRNLALVASWIGLLVELILNRPLPEPDEGASESTAA